LIVKFSGNHSPIFWHDENLPILGLEIWLIKAWEDKMSISCLILSVDILLLALVVEVVLASLAVLDIF